LIFKCYNLSYLPLILNVKDKKMAGYSKTEEKAYLQEKARELLSPLIESYFRDINLPAKASSYEGVYHWNNRYWEKTTKSEFENKCNTILQDLNLNTAIQKKVLHEFILSLGKKESELNRFGEHLFCIESGVLAFSHLIEENSEIDQLLKENVSEIQKINAKNVTIWSIPHSLCKKFYITQYSDLVFKDSPDDEAITKFSSFLEKSIVSFKDYSEFIFNLINSFFCGDDSGSFFVNFLGKTQCGKTTFVNFLTELLGGYYDIMGKNELKYESTEYSYDLYRKRNARLLTYSEPTSNPINATLIKEITGKTKFKFNDTGYYIRGRLLIDSNYPLACTDKSDNAFYERYVLVPFGPTLPINERNKDLLKELTLYKNDIFSYIIMKLSDKCLSEINLPSEEKNHLRLLSNPIKFFYETKCCKAIVNYSMSTSQLFNHYRKDFIQWYSNHVSNIDYLNDHYQMTLNASNITRKVFEQAIIHLHTDYKIGINTDSIILLGIDFIPYEEISDQMKKDHKDLLKQVDAEFKRLLLKNNLNSDYVLTYSNSEQKKELMTLLLKNEIMGNVNNPISTDQDEKYDETETVSEDNIMLDDDDYPLDEPDIPDDDDLIVVEEETDN